MPAPWSSSGASRLFTSASLHILPGVVFRRRDPHASHVPRSSCAPRYTRVSPSYEAKRARRHNGRLRAALTHDVVSLADDAVIAVCGYIVSDLIAQASEDAANDPRRESSIEPEGGDADGVDVERVCRYAAFGALDGAASHVWYNWLEGKAGTWCFTLLRRLDELQGVDFDAVLPSATTTLEVEVMETVEQVAADMVIYSPVWCVAFLAAMTWMSEGPGRVGQRLKEEWKTLYLGNLAFWVPANILIYGLTPVDHRVAAFTAINVLYTAGLSRWAESTPEARADETQGAALTVKDLTEDGADASGGVTESFEDVHAEDVAGLLVDEGEVQPQV